MPVKRYAELQLAIEVVDESNIRLTKEQYQFQIRDAIGGHSVIGVIYNVLRECQDELPAAANNELMFITDDALRVNLINDIGAIEGALANCEWKAANVLAGAAIKSLLLWRLMQFPEPELGEAVGQCLASGNLKQRPKDELENWSLRPMIEVAAQLNRLAPHTATEARQCSDFRNLIHPGRAFRTGTECNRGTAYSAVAALDFVIRDLSQPAGP